MSFFKLQIYLYIYIFHLSDGSLLLTLLQTYAIAFSPVLFFTQKRQISNQPTNKRTKVLDTLK